jgi:methylphosphotriester-DNA--protein-cysteine methyltransferase
MSGLSEEEFEKQRKDALINEIWEMIDDENYTMRAKSVAREEGYAEVRRYFKKIEGLGEIKLVWKMDLSEGRKYLDNKVFSL